MSLLDYLNPPGGFALTARDPSQLFKWPMLIIRDGNTVFTAEKFLFSSMRRSRRRWDVRLGTALLALHDVELQADVE